MLRLFLLLLLACGPVFAAPGSLVIVGGALDAGNREVHRAFLDRRPADARTIAIIPSASGYPADSARRFAEALIRHGADPADIVVVHLAAVDDPDTPDVNEAAWAANAGDAAEIAKIEGAGAIWFAGGDQLRTTRLLLDAKGGDTLMLAAIRARLAAGAVVGGSSAGAAIMSRVMITNGESMAALTMPVLRQAIPDNREEGGALVLDAGLGFLPVGLVDQHFDARARLGRLARALFALPPLLRIGFGVDENSALVVDLARAEGQAIGAGNVTLLDARMARGGEGEPFRATGLRLGLANGGDRFALSTLTLVPAAGKQPVAARATDRSAMADMGGMAVPPMPLVSLLGEEFLLRKGSDRLERLSFRDSKGVVFAFSRQPGSAVYRSRGAGAARTSIADVGFAIRPVTLSMQETGR